MVAQLRRPNGPPCSAAAAPWSILAAKNIGKVDPRTQAGRIKPTPQLSIREPVPQLSNAPWKSPQIGFI